MGGRWRWITVLAAVVALAAAAGCGGPPKAAIRYMTGGPDETVKYDLAIYQMARGEKMQVFLFRRTAAPVGEADPDFELVLLELPHRDRYGWVKEDDVQAYRWIRQNSHDSLWRATSGQVSMHESADDSHIHLDFQTTMEPILSTPGGAYVFSGNVQCNEDIIQAQGLKNRYGDWLLTLVGKKPTEPPKPPAKSPA
ncbi:MAG: hypothetical protein NT049_05330, partial [Planctomycetota bacterium]|nr:hypothetical protein [Planctomycetota bacterium]